MNQTNLNEHKYQQQLSRYHSSLLPEFESKEELNLRIRLDTIVKIVNSKCILLSPLIRFQITSKLFNKMLASIKPEISQHTKVQSVKCEKLILNENEYKKPARNMLNRWKPAILADHVLHNIIFVDIYNHCYTICRLNRKDDNEILKLFVTILQCIFSATVKFSQTKPQPLIFHAIFHRDNRFKKACVKFLTHFKVIQFWDQTVKKAEIRFNSFKKCLSKINYLHISNAIVPIMLDPHIMSVNQHNQPCCIHYKNVTTQYIMYIEIAYRMNERQRISNKHFCDEIIQYIVQYNCYGMEFFTINTVQKPYSFPITQSYANTNVINVRNYVNNQNNKSQNNNNNNLNRQRSCSDNSNSNTGNIIRHNNNLFLQHRHSDTCLQLYRSQSQPIMQQTHSSHLPVIYNTNMYPICPMAPIYNNNNNNNNINIRSQQYRPMQSTYNHVNSLASVPWTQTSNNINRTYLYQSSHNHNNNNNIVMDTDHNDERMYDRSIRDEDGDIMIMPSIDDKNDSI